MQILQRLPLGITEAFDRTSQMFWLHSGSSRIWCGTSALLQHSSCLRSVSLPWKGRFCTFSSSFTLLQKGILYKSTFTYHILPYQVIFLILEANHYRW